MRYRRSARTQLSPRQAQRRMRSACERACECGRACAHSKATGWRQSAVRNCSPSFGACRLTPSPGADVGRGEPSPGADVGRGEPSPGADVVGVSPVLVQMWAGRGLTHQRADGRRVPPEEERDDLKRRMASRRRGGEPTPGADSRGEPSPGADVTSLDGCDSGRISLDRTPRRSGTQHHAEEA